MTDQLLQSREGPGTSASAGNAINEPNQERRNSHDLYDDIDGDIESMPH